jgi:protein phosphatase
VIRFAHGASTDVGRVRSLNEDSLLVADPVFAVADGMGGHRGGEVASATALDTMGAKVIEPTIDALAEAVQAANRAVFDQAQLDPELSGMGTTLCAIGLVRTSADGSPAIGIVNVGDSRVYLLDGDRFAQLSEDHSLVETMVRGGQLSADEALVHPGRNVLTRALGIERQVEVDCWTVALKVGDRFLLCSDGLFNEMHDDQIAAVLRRLTNPGEAADELVRLARESGGRDNITAVIVDVLSDDGAADGSTGGGIDDRLVRVSEEHDDLAELDEPRDPTSPVPTIPIVTPAPEGPTPVMTPVIHRGQRQHRRLTWRTAMFLLAIVVVVAVGVGAAVYAGRGTYFVGVRNGRVQIFRGHPGGFLWFDPTVAGKSSGIPIGEVPATYRSEVRTGHGVGSLAEAKRFVLNLEQKIDQLAPPPTSTTTVPIATTLAAGAVTSTVPTTTLPVGP